MKKIIAVFDGLKYSEGTRDYAIAFSKQTDTHLVGIFLDDPSYTSYKIYELITKEGIAQSGLKKFEEKDKATRAAAAENFEKACQQSGVEYSLHHDHDIAINILKHESIYADLLVIDANETLTHYTEKLPTRFIRDLLEDVQSPVLIVPHKYKPIQNILVLYDGAPSSVHAIKMFSYLLSQLKSLDINVISVNPENATLHLPDNKLMKEYMKRHFPTAKYIVLKGRAEDEIIKYLKQTHQHTLVVLGTYRRGTVSRWFRESMADILMREVHLPLFIAHTK